MTDGRGRRGWVRLAVAAGASIVITAVPACSDDDPRDRPPASSSTLPVTAPEQVVELEGRPSAVAVGADGSVYVADDAAGPDAGRVQVLSPGSGEPVAAVTVGPAPVALVPAADAMWVVGATGTVTRVVHAALAGPPELVAGEPVEVGGALVDGVVAGDRLYVGDIESSVVHVLDATTGVVSAAAIAVPAGVVRLEVAGERMWVTGREDEVTPIELASGAVGGPVGVGAGPIGAVATAEVLWVANSDDATVSRLDPVSGASLAEPVPVGPAPIALAVEGGVLWVLEQDGPSLSRLDVATGQRLAEPVPLPMRPRGFAVTPTGVWVVGVDPSVAVHVPHP